MIGISIKSSVKIHRKNSSIFSVYKPPSALSKLYTGLRKLSCLTGLSKGTTALIIQSCLRECVCQVKNNRLNCSTEMETCPADVATGCMLIEIDRGGHCSQFTGASSEPSAALFPLHIITHLVAYQGIGL